MKRQLTEAEARAREERLTAAGIKVVTDAPSTVTLLRQRPKGTGEIVLLPGVRRPAERHA